MTLVVGKCFFAAAGPLIGGYYPYKDSLGTPKAADADADALRVTLDC
jgi:hypothetical protein